MKTQKSRLNKLPEKPRVGVGVIILRGKKLLMLKRRGSHGSGTWNLPGGHLEFGETIIKCVRREVFEETGLKVKESKVICVNEELNFIKSDNRHYITIGCVAKIKSGKTKLKELEKCEELGWFCLESLPKPLFLPSENILECFKKGVISLAN